MKNLLLSFMLTIFTVAGFSQELKFQLEPRKQYKEVKTINESVYLNGEFSHSATISEKTASLVLDRVDDRALVRTSVTDSVYKAIFGEISGLVLDSSREFDYYRDDFGNIEMVSDSVFPVLRNIPVFPNAQEPLTVGQKWYNRAQESHDLKEFFGIEEPLMFPVAVENEFLGRREFNGRDCYAISIKYNIYHKPESMKSIYNAYPVKITGFSKRVVYWDDSIGLPAGSDETFSIVFEMSDGQILEYKGEAHSKTTQTRILTEEEFVGVKNALEDEITKVEQTEEGIHITLENIQFTAESSALMPQERTRLDAVAEQLKEFQDRDIVIVGHTAMAGTEEGRYQLSERRASVVFDYLTEKGAFGAAQNIVLVPMGAKQPHPEGNNSTPEGMAKNRRVEIIIQNN